MSFWNRRSSDDDLDREIRDHLELEADENRARGIAADEAGFAARRRFGNVGLVKEAVRATRWSARFDTLRQDLRYALRGLRRSPAFTATAILSLTLGIGANTAVFSLLNALLLRTLPVSDPGQLVQVSIVGAGEPRQNFSLHTIGFLDEPTNGLSGVCAFALGESYAIGDTGSDRRASGTWMTGDCYRVLGVRFSVGRGFRPEDDRPEGGANGLVAVISDGYWTRELQRAEDVVGKQIVIDGKSVTIVGVTAPGFTGPNVGRTADITMPVSAMPQLRPDGPPIFRPGINWLRLWGRLAPGVSAEQAAARMTVAWSRAIDQAVEPRAREAMRTSRIELTRGATGWSDLRRQFARPLFVLSTIVGLVLLIACANLASLMLARAEVRRREIAVRLAMGAARARLIRQAFTESVMLALFGSVAGLLVAQLATRGLLALLAVGRGRAIELELKPDARVLAFSLAAAALTSILFGLIPALRATAVDETSALRDATRSRGARRGRLASLLVVAQAALSLVLVAGAAFFLRTLDNLLRVDTGYRRDGVTLVSVEPPRTTDVASQASLAQEILDELRALPGVQAASLSGGTPATGGGWTLSVKLDGDPAVESPEAVIVTASASYFDVYGIELRAGRHFTRADDASAPPVVVVNDAFVRERFNGANPLGQRIRVGSRGLPFEIVGVVENVSFEGARRPTRPAVYLSFFQAPNPQLRGGASIALLADPAALSADAIRQRIRAKSPAAAVGVRQFREIVDSSIVNERLLALLAGIFGTLALGLAAIGLYGLLAFDVSSRTAELGVRAALGAPRARVMWLVLADALKLVGAGVVIGLPAVWVTTRLIAGMLFGLTPTDPATITIAVGLLVTTTFVAAWVPARRAMRIDPITALRAD